MIMCFSEIDLRTKHILIAVENRSWLHFAGHTFEISATIVDSHFYWFFSYSDVDLCIRCREQTTYTFILMDDDSCVLKYIEIVPLDNNAEQTEDLKPFEVKVCIVDKFLVCRQWNMKLEHTFLAVTQSNLCLFQSASFQQCDYCESRQYSHKSLHSIDWTELVFFKLFFNWVNVWNE